MAPTDVVSLRGFFLSRPGGSASTISLLPWWAMARHPGGRAEDQRRWAGLLSQRTAERCLEVCHGRGFHNHDYECY